MTKTATPEMIADEAMKRIWTDWLAYHNAQFSGRKYYITAADQMAFYEIAQPIMRSLALHAAEARAATLPADHPEDFTADVWQQHKDLIEEAGKLREENARLQASLTDEVTVRLNAEARAATLSAAKAATQADYETRVRSALATPSTDLREENERQPMKLEISKEWFAKRAAMEGDLEIAKLESLLPRQDEITQLRDRAVTAETEIAALKEKLETVVGAIKALVSLNDEHHPVGGQIYQDRVERIWCRAKAALAREGK